MFQIETKFYIKTVREIQEETNEKNFIPLSIGIYNIVHFPLIDVMI